MPVDLSVEFMGVRLKNPFLVASVPSTTAAGFHKAAKAGWAGGIIWGGELNTNSISFNRGYIPREIEYVGKPPQWWAYQNSACHREAWNLAQICPPERVAALIRKAKESGIPVGCNVVESAPPMAWRRTAAAAERGGADFLELNWSCPFIPGIGLEVGLDREKREAIIRAVRQECSLPIMVKLNASLVREALEESARGAVEAGANAISITNTLSGVIGVDIETGMPMACEMDVDGRVRGMVGGISGPAVKPMGLRGVAEVRSVVDVPISGIGGITDWQSAVEYMLLGASTVQVGTAVMLYGYRMIDRLVRGLENWMERKGYKRLEDFVGMTSEKYLVGEPHTRPAEKQPRKMIVDETKCNGCGLCVSACDASSSEAEAIQILDGLAEIDHERCHTCSSCLIVCPEGAISMQWEPAYLK